MPESERKQVLDDEGTVDKKLKSEIIRTRRRVSDREDDIFTRARLEGVDYTHKELTEIWKTPVRQYLRRIEPLLTAEDIDEAEHYYNGVELVSEDITPPSGPTRVFVKNAGKYQSVKDGYAVLPWDELYTNTVQKTEYKHLHELFSDGMQVPHSRDHTVTGLLSVIKDHAPAYEWRVQLNDAINPADQLVAVPRVTRTFTKQELEKALRMADQFLQHHAGIGMDIETPGMDTWGFEEVEEDVE